MAGKLHPDCKAVRGGVLKHDAPREGQTEPERKDRYRELFERSADAILIIDGDTFIDCNEATVRMLRYRDKAELLQTHPSELSPEFQPDGRRSYDKANEMMAIAFEWGSHRFEWDHRRADGEVFPVEVLLTAVPEGDKFILHVVWRDITDRKRLEEELRHAQKMEAIGQLAGGIAHDFNNLLVVIVGYADLLAARAEERPELQQHLREIHRAADRATTLTAQLLAFSRKQVLKPEVIDLNVVLAELGQMLRRLIGEHIRVAFQCRDGSVFVKADPGQIEQVILNIATNSRDAMPEGGTLTIGTSRVRLDETDSLGLPPGDYAALRITDTGVGMSAEAAMRAFDPFFTTKERGRGTGLGLASVYGIVKQSGGDVRISSRVNAGTTVEVLLPWTDEHPALDARSAPPRAARHHGEGTVLVAEDEPAVAGLIRRVLLQQGYRVREACNGAEALKLAEKERFRFDLLLTDVVMPVMSGPELVRRLRETRPDLPVLFMSGYTDDALAEHGFKMEDVDLLRKPFSPAQLVARVREFLGEQE
jgi:PAS domain S-box-containing protein